MLKHNRQIILAMAPLLLAFSSGASVAKAQAAKSAPGKMATKQAEKKRAQEMMPDMMGAPHHTLAMAYRDNLVTFARMLRGQVMQSKSVNLDLARPAMDEMRRSFNQLKLHHQAQASMMGEARMAGAMERMQTHLPMLNDHLTALENELRSSSPDPKKVSGHLTEILSQCASMSGGGTKGEPQKKK